MIFSTPVFVFLFLPLTLAGYYLLARSRPLRLGLLAVASVVFYGWWDVRLVPLLVASVAANWLVALLFRRSGRLSWLTLGVVFNLLLLASFKYADFLVSSLLGIAGLAPQKLGIVLPLGISFFTFQQISYLVDLRRGARSFYGFGDYFLFVTYFPQLIAGPIVRHDEIIEQFSLDPRRAEMWEGLSRGAVLFAIGLAKKVLLADPIAQVCDPLYGQAVLGQSLGMGEAWAAGIGFTLQVYFDFSGYSDMAIGMGRMFGFRIPINFDAPYRAASIGEFWRRWHITLSRFLRDYLYIPLGGNRLGGARRTLNVVLTMLLGGLWHGAGWTYVVWGGLHGVALAVQGGWRHLGARPLPRPVGWFLTMFFFVATIVLFRAAAFGPAGEILASMFGAHGMAGVPWDGTRLLLAGAAVSLLGPTSQTVALDRLGPRRWLALAAGAAAVYVLLVMGEGHHPEFIYFQF